MNLVWLVNRLRAMGPAEILHRVAEATKRGTARDRLEGWSRYAAPGAAPSAAPRLPALAALALRLASDRPDEVAAAAEATLAGRFGVLGRTWPQRDPARLFPADLWRLDPVTGALWPGAEHYCFDIPYRHESGRGDVKYVWEINRLQFLQPLAIQAARRDDAGALAAIEAAIASWHTANPPFRGLNWNSGIELALRGISLLVVSSLVGERLGEATVHRLRAILAASLFWLRRYPSRFSSANNHRIAEAAAIYLIGLAMPELADAAEAVRDARRILDGEAGRQVFADGVPAEQSPTYGAFSAEFLLVAHAVAPLAPATLDRLRAFADFIAWLADADGRVPAIGDDDEGLVLALGAPPKRYAADIAARITDRITGRITGRIAAPEPRAGLMSFAEGGYSVLRDRGWHLVFDHGPLGYLSIAAHGHADALALTLARRGRPLLVDPGTYLYHASDGWRDWFRGTAAHTTLRLGGLDQSRITGPFNWSRKAKARLETPPPGETWQFVASHDGYEATFGVRHRRSLAIEGDSLVIKDQLIGATAPRQAEIAFQFAPDLALELAEGLCRVTAAGKPVAVLRFAPTGVLTLHIGAPPASGGGWVSPRYGVMVPAPRLVWTGPVGADGVTTTITPEDDTE